MKRNGLVICLFAIALILVFSYGCKKSAPVYNNLIIGNWEYQYSVVDSFINGKWNPPIKGYDSSVADNFAESLYFKSNDTLIYSYSGITAWSNYTIRDNHLILIGSNTADTLIIHSLSNSNLQIGKETSFYTYWMNFSKK